MYKRKDKDREEEGKRQQGQQWTSIKIQQQSNKIQFETKTMD